MSTPPAALAIRADADSRIGIGHVMRCLAIAAAYLSKGGPVSLYSLHLPESMESRIRSAGMDVIRLVDDRWTSFVHLLERDRPAWVIIDGYAFGASEQQALHAAGLRTVFFDDYGHGSPYSADWIINQNLGADPSLYRDRSSSTQLLQGPDYVQLRPEFAPHRRYRKSIEPVARRLLLTMGGADPENVTGVILQQLPQLADNNWEAVAVVGAANPHRQRLESCDDPRIRIAVDVADMSELYRWADLAIAAGGTTSWERAYFGVPSLIVSLAANQDGVAAACAAAGIAGSLGRFSPIEISKLLPEIAALMADRDRRQLMSHRGQRLIDGQGTKRLLSILLDEPMLSVRPATTSDMKMVWEWSNDPVTRASSFHSDPIPWDDHCAWMTQRLLDPQTVFLIGEWGAGQAIGQVRFQMEGQEATISVSLAPSARGRGLSTPLILEACDTLFRNYDVQQVLAWIREENAVSKRTFEKAGFLLDRHDVIRGHASRRYRLPR